MKPENKLNVLIVDDEKPARERVKQLLAKIEIAVVVGEASGGNEAISLIEELQPDVVILDIQMKDIDGMRVLESLDDPPAVIFSTAYEQHALKAFELDAVDYLLKPYSAERLKKALEKAARFIVDDSSFAAQLNPVQKIAAMNGLSVELVLLEDIIGFEIIESVVFLLRKDGEKLIYDSTLNNLEEILPPSIFFRANRKAIINLSAVNSYIAAGDGGVEVKLKGGFKMTVSRRRTPHLKTRLKHSG